MSVWTPIIPEADGTIGRREALLWFGICCFLCINLTAYARFCFEEIFGIALLFTNKQGVMVFHVLSAIATVVIFYWLAQLLPKLLYRPAYVVSNRKVPDEYRDTWVRALFYNGVFCGLLGFDYFVNIGLSLGGSTGYVVSTFLLLGFSAYALLLGWSADKDGPADLPQDRTGSVARLVIRISVWSNGLFLLSECFTMPYMTMPEYRHVAIQWALSGTFLAVVRSRFDGERGPLSLGLAASLLGQMVVGPWLSRLASLVLVLLAQLFKHRNLRGALLRVWGFGLGQAAGRLIGAFTGLFFLGLEGGAMGAAVGEALMATLGYQFAGDAGDRLASATKKTSPVGQKGGDQTLP